MNGSFMIFWKILLAHFVADFILQPGSLVENKGEIKTLFFHCSIFFLLSNLSLLPAFSLTSVITLGCLSALHGVIDALKNLIQKRQEKGLWICFLGDQALHLLGIGAVVLILEKAYYDVVAKTVARYWSNSSLFLIASFFVSIIFGGSYFIGAFCRDFLEPVGTGKRPGIDRAGRYLGMVERSLVLTAVLVGKVEFIGYIFAAKSIARYPEMKVESHFAEYYLIGTLTSISIAFFGGLLLKYLLGW